MTVMVSLLAQYRLIVSKLVGTAVVLIVLLWASVSIHEAFHQLVARSLGVEMRIEVWWGATGIAYFMSPSTEAQRVVIGFAGGVGTALVMGILWLVSALQARYSRWELDMAVSAFFVMMIQLVYAPFDGLSPHSTVWLPAIIAGAATTIVYGNRWLQWVVNGTNGPQRVDRNT